MSDLEAAIFDSQITGHLLSGETLESTDITAAAFNADLASKLAGSHHDLSSAEEEILKAKVASKVALDGEYHPGDIIHDHLEAHMQAGLADQLMS